MVATTGPRYFGFVIRGALDAATAADLLAVSWGQPAYNHLSSPASALVEEVAAPGSLSCSVSLVTCRSGL
jgi:hypothetical protein